MPTVSEVMQDTPSPQLAVAQKSYVNVWLHSWRNVNSELPTVPFLMPATLQKVSVAAWHRPHIGELSPRQFSHSVDIFCRLYFFPPSNRAYGCTVWSFCALWLSATIDKYCTNSNVVIGPALSPEKDHKSQNKEVITDPVSSAICTVSISTWVLFFILYFWWNFPLTWAFRNTWDLTNKIIA